MLQFHYQPNERQQMTKVEQVRNPNDFGDYVRGLNVFGYAVPKPASLALAVVA